MKLLKRHQNDTKTTELEASKHWVSFWKITAKKIPNKNCPQRSKPYISNFFRKEASLTFWKNAPKKVSQKYFQKMMLLKKHPKKMMPKKKVPKNVPRKFLPLSLSSPPAQEKENFESELQSVGLMATELERPKSPTERRSDRGGFSCLFWMVFPE